MTQDLLVGNLLEERRNLPEWFSQDWFLIESKKHKQRWDVSYTCFRFVHLERTSSLTCKQGCFLFLHVSCSLFYRPRYTTSLDKSCLKTPSYLGQTATTAARCCYLPGVGKKRWGQLGCYSSSRSSVASRLSADHSNQNGSQNETGDGRVIREESSGSLW